MAISIVTNAQILINAVDLSDHVESVGIDPKAADIDVTAMSALGWKAFLAGLKEFALQVTFQQDFAASKVYATLWPLLGTVTTFEVRAVNAARSATNPAFTGSVVVSEVPLLQGAQVGQLSKVQVNWTGTGALTPLTS
jgi:hypothetical protein